MPRTCTAAAGVIAAAQFAGAGVQTFTDRDAFFGAASIAAVRRRR